MSNKNRKIVRRSSRKRQSGESSPSVPEPSPNMGTQHLKGQKARGRKRSLAAEVVTTEPCPKIQKTVEGRKVDGYCWVCHQMGQEVICSRCPRVYHNKCLQKSHISLSTNGQCEECRPQSLIKGVKPQKIQKSRMKELLELAMAEALKNDAKKNSLKRTVPKQNPNFIKHFKSWPKDSCDKLCQIMDLDILTDKINEYVNYQTVAAFYIDVKWIHHNCHIIYGAKSKITELAVKMEKNFKKELLDIEGCQECYYDKLDDHQFANYFTNVCEVPHEIVWAKLRGSPYWPAKCLRIYNGNADVRFFATHDRSVIPLNQCFRISQSSPNERENKQARYLDAIKELAVYVNNFRVSHGCFTYYPSRTPLVCNDSPTKSAKRGRPKRSISDSNLGETSPCSESIRTELDADNHTVSSSEISENDSSQLNISIEDPASNSLSQDELSPQIEQTRQSTSTAGSVPKSFPNYPGSSGDDSVFLQRLRDCIPDSGEENSDFCDMLYKFVFGPSDNYQRFMPSTSNQDDDVVFISEKQPVVFRSLKEFMKDTSFSHGFAQHIMNYYPTVQDCLKKSGNFTKECYMQRWSGAHVEGGENCSISTSVKCVQQLINEREAAKAERQRCVQEYISLNAEHEKLEQESLDADHNCCFAINNRKNARFTIETLIWEALIATRICNDHSYEGKPWLELLSCLDQTLDDVLKCVAEKEEECNMNSEKIDNLMKQTVANQPVISHLEKQCRLQEQAIKELQKRIKSCQIPQKNAAVQTVLMDSSENIGFKPKKFRTCSVKNHLKESVREPRVVVRRLRKIEEKSSAKLIKKEK